MSQWASCLPSASAKASRIWRSSPSRRWQAPGRRRPRHAHRPGTGATGGCPRAREARLLIRGLLSRGWGPELGSTNCGIPGASALCLLCWVG
ncbi:hypothetical protein ARUE_c10060 [Arthrobacter sp. Rue61a]|nr:hypothetical protein ARUE_c10060 [Arthrobacter sp. Rue61a]